MRILNRITNNEYEQFNIYKCIMSGTWEDDTTYKPICDRLRKLGYKIIKE